MKKIYAALGLLCLIPATLSAQTPTQPPLIGTLSQSAFQRVGAMDTCGVDTLGYVWTKTSSTLGVTMNVPSEFFGYAQYYDAPQEVTIHGMTFYAGVNSSNANDTAVIKCAVYLANPDSSVGQILDSVDVVAYNTYNPVQPNMMEISVTFNNPVVVNQPYFVSLQTNTNLPLGVLTNDYNNGDGGMEELGYWRWTGDNVWYPSNEFFAWDVDYLILPHVTYDIWGAYSLNTNEICAPDSVCASVDSIAPIYYSRMYNQNALNVTAESGFGWVWGDATPSQLFADTCHFYTAAGNYLPRLSMNLVGWNTVCVLNIYDSVAVGAAPVANYNVAQDELVIDLTEIITNGADSIIWDLGDGNTSTASMPTHVYAQPGTYTVCLTAMNSCGADVVCMPVTVCAPPTASYNFVIDTLQVDFTDLSASDDVVISWQWDFGDTNTSTMQNPTHTYQNAGTYTVCLIASDSCSADTFCSVVDVIGVGMEEQSLFGGLEVYPTLASDVLHVKGKVVGVDAFTVSILDITGRTLFVQSFKGNQGVSETIVLEGFAPGKYIVQFSSDKGAFTRSFIKE